MAEDRDRTQTRYRSCVPLVAEDDRDFQLFLKRAFAKAGVPSVRTVADGDEAVQALDQAIPGGAVLSNVLPSLIVLDLLMPKKSGLEVLAWIRERPGLSEIPVFILSSSERPDHVERAFSLRVASYYVKPADPAELQKVVDGMLGYWYAIVHRRVPGLSRAQSEHSSKA